MGWLEITVLLSAIWLAQCQVVPSLPKPRIVIVGPTGAGKSSLAEAFLGCDPRGDTCMFEVCNGLDSCTKETSYGYGPWLGTGKLYTVVDTPGFGDSDGDDEELIEEMMGVLVNTIVQADTIVLLLNGKVARFEDHLVKMMRRMAVMFGQEWWDYLVIGVSFWAYDQASIDARECDPYYPDDCKDESWFKREINAQIREKFEIDRNFTFVFTDSWSQTIGHIDDTLEQEHWKEETGKLWDITTNRVDGFSFKTIDDILEENAAQRAEIKWLNDIITANITELMSRMKTNEADIDALEGTVCDVEDSIKTNTDSISTNTHNIATNTDAIHNVEEFVDHHGDNISDLQSDLTIAKVDIQTNSDNIDTNVRDITTKINTNTNNIATNTHSISNNLAKINTNTQSISTNTGKINTNTHSISTNTHNIANNTDAIHPPTVAVCGYQEHKTGTGTITYDSLYTEHITDSSTLSTTTGTFTTVTPGVYSITWSGQVFADSGESAGMFLYKNQEQVEETWYASRANGGDDYMVDWTTDQGSRTVLQCLQSGDKVDLRVDYITGDIYRVLFCVNLVQETNCSG